MSKTKILIVEDEVIIALDIKRALKKLGYEVTDTVTNYDEALNSVKENEPDIILMDIHLENSKDGIETSIEIHKSKKVPILYLTSFSDDETIKRAIDTNPIGYLIKPFKREELKSTILLGLHKLKQEEEKIEPEIEHEPLGFDYYYDFKTDNLYLKNTPIKLSVNEKKLLKILINAKGSIVTFGDIEHQIWANTAISDSTLRTLTYRLRTKLEHKLIETIPSFGCKLTTSN